MELLTFWMAVGFLLASYSVIANDSVQTLGTWIASSKNLKWQYLWVAASAVLLYTIWYGWYAYGGDISYGRLTKIPFVEIQWYHAVAPAILLVLTRAGVPVSTSFLVLAAFATTDVLEAILLKSLMGYAIAATSAYAIWFAITQYLSRYPVKDANEKFWRIAQWSTTGLLWFTWLAHDMSNIAVFLPRQIPVDMMIMISIVFVAGLGIMLYNRGGKIQEIVVNKQDTKYVRSATVIDFVYFIILWFFKELNDIPMSTTWVFVGLLAGREFAIASYKNKKIKSVFPIVGADFMKLMLGLAVSVFIVLLASYF